MTRDGNTLFVPYTEGASISLIGTHHQPQPQVDLLSSLHVTERPDWWPEDKPFVSMRSGVWYPAQDGTYRDVNGVIAGRAVIRKAKRDARRKK